MDTREVPAESIIVGDYNIRGIVAADSPAIRSLAESIRKDGLLHPLVVVENPAKTDSYLLVVGHRRFCAITTHLKAAMPTVTVRVIPYDEADRVKYTRMALAENAFRQDVSRIAIAAKLKELREQAGLSYQELADDFLGFERATSVWACIEVLNLRPEVLQAIEAKRLPFSYGRALLTLRDDPEKQLQALNRILALPEGQRTVRRAELITKALKEGKEVGRFEIRLDLPKGASVRYVRADKENDRPIFRVTFDFSTLEEFRSAAAHMLERNIEPPMRWVGEIEPKGEQRNSAA